MCILIEFLNSKAFDQRYQAILLEVLRVVIDMYSAVIGGFSSKVDNLMFKKLAKTVEDQIGLSGDLQMLKGQIVRK